MSALLRVIIERGNGKRSKKLSQLGLGKSIGMISAGGRRSGSHIAESDGIRGGVMLETHLEIASAMENLSIQTAGSLENGSHQQDRTESDPQSAASKELHHHAWSPCLNNQRSIRSTMFSQ